jgi:hypothetical protein
MRNIGLISLIQVIEAYKEDHKSWFPLYLSPFPGLMKGDNSYFSLVVKISTAGSTSISI